MPAGESVTAVHESTRRYADPVTGKWVERSTGTNTKCEAERVAAKWEAELHDGRYQKPSRISWEEFREDYSQTALTQKRPKTAESYDATFNVFERLVGSKYLASVDSKVVTSFTRALRTKQRASLATVARHLRTLRAALNWAVRMRLLKELPNFDMPKDSARMGGRPITDEEFHIMLSAVTQVVGETAAPLWHFLLRGFWVSGLRLREACNLHWCGNVGHVVDYARKRPMLRISAEFEKAGRDRLLPMAPEFAKLLETVPPEDRYGRVFELRGGRGQVVTNPHRIGRTISLIGQAADIVTKYNPTTGEPEKYATTHDLRRAFGFRWSRRVLPQELMELMRHTRIETTMKYYVGENADATAEKIWSLYDTSYDIGGFESEASSKTSVF